IADRGDGSGPFVAEHRARSRVTLEHEVQVRAADAAVRNLEQHVVRTDCGNRKPLYLDRAFAHVDGGVHELGGDVVGHDASFAARTRKEQSRRRGAGGFVSQASRRQIARTFCASSPLRPGATSNSTFWPSSSVRYPLPWMLE